MRQRLREFEPASMLITVPRMKFYLSDDQKQWTDRKVAEGHFGSIDKLICDLLADDKRRFELEAELRNERPNGGSC